MQIECLGRSGVARVYLRATSASARMHSRSSSYAGCRSKVCMRGTLDRSAEDEWQIRNYLFFIIYSFPDCPLYSCCLDRRQAANWETAHPMSSDVVASWSSPPGSCPTWNKGWGWRGLGDCRVALATALRRIVGVGYIYILPDCSPDFFKSFASSWLMLRAQ